VSAYMELSALPTADTLCKGRAKAVAGGNRARIRDSRTRAVQWCTGAHHGEDRAGALPGPIAIAPEIYSDMSDTSLFTALSALSHPCQHKDWHQIHDTDKVSAVHGNRNRAKGHFKRFFSLRLFFRNLYVVRLI
jgi:hypothetical protein